MNVNVSVAKSVGFKPLNQF